MNGRSNERAQSVAEVCGHSLAGCPLIFRVRVAAPPPLLAAIVAVLPHPVLGAAGMRLQAFPIREFSGDLA